MDESGNSSSDESTSSVATVSSDSQEEQFTTLVIVVPQPGALAIRHSMGDLIEQSVTRLYVNRVVATQVDLSKLPPSTSKFAKLRGKLFTEEGNIGNGKTELNKGCIELLNSEGIPSRGFEEPISEPILELFYAHMETKPRNPYAYAAQIYFATQRGNINHRAQAWTGKLPSEYPIIFERIGAAMTDRSSLCDVLFAIGGYLMGGINNPEWKGVLSATSNNFDFDAVVFLDVSSKRSEYIIKHVRGRPFEKKMPLAYLQRLRLLHYALFRRLAQLGAAVVYAYIDDQGIDPEEKKQLVYFDPKVTLLALKHAPRGDVCAELWRDAPTPTEDMTEEEVSAALDRVRHAYETSGKVSKRVRDAANQSKTIPID